METPAFLSSIIKRKPTNEIKQEYTALEKLYDKKYSK